MKTFGRSVGCGTEPARIYVDRGVPLEGVRGFYGKMTLRRTNQNNGARVAQVARHP